MCVCGGVGVGGREGLCGKSVLVEGVKYVFSYYYTVEPLYSGHPWGPTFWPLYRGGLNYASVRMRKRGIR